MSSKYVCRLLPCVSRSKNFDVVLHVKPVFSPRILSTSAVRKVDEEGDECQKREGNNSLNGRLKAFFPFEDFAFLPPNMRHAMNVANRFLDDPFFGPRSLRESPMRGVYRSPWDVREVQTEFQLRMELPGLSKEEVKVYVEDGCLCISGRQNEANKDSQDIWSSGYSSNYAKFSLPENVQSDQIKAELKNGVLLVSVPKIKPEAKEKQVIEVEVA